MNTKKENMIDVKSKRCLEEKCNKIPIFNLPNNKKGIYCSDHKIDGMIDVISKRCLEENCNIQASFNFKNETISIYCNKHKEEGMINIRGKKCLEENCDKQSSFGYKENISIYCASHKLEDMICVKNKLCKLESCNTIVNSKYKGYCLRCFIFKFPTEKISRHYKVKENHMTDFIKANFNDEVMIFDKQTSGCSKRRPDVYIDKFTHIIIIECDENQHRDTSCENMRTMELFQDFANRPIVFIRFNPDKYINKKNQKIPSSFKMHKILDVPVVREPKEWKLRLDLLKETINKYLENIPEKEVTNEFLFYDYNI